VSHASTLGKREKERGRKDEERKNEREPFTVHMHACKHALPSCYSLQREREKRIAKEEGIPNASLSSVDQAKWPTITKVTIALKDNRERERERDIETERESEWTESEREREEKREREQRKSDSLWFFIPKFAYLRM
jgi:hypothetical protein